MIIVDFEVDLFAAQSGIQGVEDIAGPDRVMDAVTKLFGNDLRHFQPPHKPSGTWTAIINDLLILMPPPAQTQKMLSSLTMD